VSFRFLVRRRWGFLACGLPGKGVALLLLGAWVCGIAHRMVDWYGRSLG
jgi:hypothetical protein